MSYVTIEEVATQSGYSKHTLKMLIVDGVLPQSCGRRNKKGIYPVSIFNCLSKYIELKATGIKKSEIISTMLKEKEND